MYRRSCCTPSCKRERVESLSQAKAYEQVCHLMVSIYHSLGQSSHWRRLDHSRQSGDSAKNPLGHPVTNWSFGQMTARDQGNSRRRPRWACTSSSSARWSSRLISCRSLATCANCRHSAACSLREGGRTRLMRRDARYSGGSSRRLHPAPPAHGREPCELPCPNARNVLLGFRVFGVFAREYSSHLNGLERASGPCDRE